MDENTNSTVDCGRDDCGACTRKDVSHITATDVKIVTYVGDYAVTTVVSPELRDPVALMCQQMGLMEVPLFTVIVGYVGKGSILESKDTVDDDEYMRFVERHSNLDGVKDSHDMVVEQVRNGLLDLSEGIAAGQMEEESKKYFQDALDKLSGSDPFGLGL